MSTVEELQQTIIEERRQHQQTMETMLRQLETIQSVLEDQKQLLQELITRVTKLRVLKYELLTNESGSIVKQLKFNTGSKGVDELLYRLHDMLEEATLTGGTVLDKLYRAAQQILTHGKSSTSSTKRSSDIAFVVRKDIRGSQSWARKHYKKCSTCGNKRAGLPSWEQTNEKSLGITQLQDLSSIPGKCFYKAAIRFFKKKCGERMLDIFRVSAVVAMRGKNGSRITDPAATANKITEVITVWIQKELAAAREKAKKAPWNEEATKNLLLSGAIEVFLHSLNVTVTVSVASPTLANVMDPGCTPMDVNVVILTPTYIPALSSLLGLLSDGEQRAYFVKHIIEPLAERLGKFVDMVEVVTRYTSLATNVVDSLILMAQSKRLSEVLQKDVPQNVKITPQETTKRLQAVFWVLAAFGASVEVDCAIPFPGDISDIAGVKEAVLNAAESFLRLLTAPKPYTTPPTDDPKAANLIIRLLRAPTMFLEILNSTFSSNRRLPSTARVDVADLLVSPKAKIRYGLKIFSEIIVNIYRPYAPSTGVVIADENGRGGKPKAAGCIPVANMPRDIVRANMEVAEQAESYMKRLVACRKDTEINSKLSQTGKALLKQMILEAHEDTLFFGIYE
ncbi:hypothetical protein TraAM80_01889 [Trypanosoma rangeli]|uniref:Uncharacterized protein n=1 Tax=Trypanosoma rangeli TaxID=5698 RepID=A0A3R7NYR2_TRYRA|nr:uncharacterized protein TraAM80_01889 [Trypanosoma rangeli]RNF09864.1 hypothetical protein TraAM80_01889 [Trypanosoma rangeli]|eukprot:RNF09864.1 hypothetical protein TraAM80_01889 [Trypanosoma rangeli]